MNFGIEPSESEKIDYIYKTLRNQARWRYAKMILYILVIGYIYFQIGAIIQSGNTQKIQEVVIDNIKAIVLPIVKETSKDIIESQKPDKETMQRILQETLQQKSDLGN